MLNFKFNFEKTLQAAALILRQHHDRMEYIRLLKLLYIADRQLLAETGMTLTGDRAYAMKQGPVLSKVYDLIKGQGHPSQESRWGESIRKDGYEVVLDLFIDPVSLTNAEVNKIIDLCKGFRDTDSEQLSDLSHDFEEWAQAFDSRNPQSSYPIDWETALVAQGKSHLIEDARELLAEADAADAAFKLC